MNQLQNAKLYIYVVLSIQLVFVGCSSINAPDRQLSKAIREFEKNINRHAWRQIRSQISEDFVWYDNVNKTQGKDNRQSSRDEFISSLRAAADTNTVKFKSLKAIIIDKTQIQCYLQIFIMADKQEKFQWRTRMDWRHENIGWVLIAAKDITPIRRQQKNGILGELNDFADYATGASPTRVLKKTRKKVNEIQEQHNKKLMDAMDFDK
ncbi:MAG: nuclear transport factor 2 family protein [Chlamydiota bacterium]|nr:nuclear transport factor 2 family protein [Chlamydiota bacterium]